MLFHINTGQVIKKNIAGSASKIKEKKSGNDPERSMCVNVYIVFFFEEMIKIETANNNNADGCNTVTHKTVFTKMTGNTFIAIKPHKQ